MTRICLLTDSLAPSGVGAHMMALAEGLPADDIVVAARPGSGLLERAAAAGFAVKALDDDPGLARWLRQARPDIIHVHAGIGWEGHAAVRAAHAVGVPVIRTEHLPYLLTDPAQRDEHRESASMLARLICVSDAVRDTHRAAGVDPVLIDTIHNGVMPHHPSRSRAVLRGEWAVGDAPVLLMVGRFAEQKGHALLLDALPAVRALYPDVIVLLAGDGPLLIPTARSVSARGLAGSVRMLGNRSDVADLMTLADLLVLPSAFEGLPLVALEAMAAGLPVVATFAPGNAEAIEDGVTGRLTAADPASFADAIVSMLADRDTLATIGTAAIERQQAQFSADRMIAETRAVYAGVQDQTETKEGDSVERTRIGFIGAGGIAHRHFGVLEQFDDVAIVAVADVDMARATEAAARFGARAFDDAAAMLASIDLDALYICVPPFAHGEPERLSIDHHLPFFVEKPVAIDLGTAEDVAASVDRLGLVTAVGYHWRYLDTVDEVKALLSATPARLLSGYWLDSTPPPRWWWRKDASGGQMLEQTTHLVDLARYLVGDVVRVYGQSGHVERAAFPDLDVATTSTAMLTFASGAIANFASTCLLNWNHRVGLHLFGEGLAIELTDRDVMIDIGRGRPVRGTQSDPVVLEDRDFIDAVRGGENRIRCPYPAALETLRLALAIERSASEGRAIDVREREAAHV
ncbi:glycosyltransferase [Sphingomonas sp. TREG-RG-20F-R18-01]|uniref:glycosyltransferase n=1 Tax=Sphingomonas sp. TREG-RG-20F-R18-01 TaxID=2914982 RepID=UPI001F59E172|nr:glycosyltransferase [Sphingomonas sp. TREG-RG-20F-R18-01]